MTSPDVHIDTHMPLPKQSPPKSKIIPKNNALTSSVFPAEIMLLYNFVVMDGYNVKFCDLIVD
jgi:hypothetical protein